MRPSDFTFAAANKLAREVRFIVPTISPVSNASEIPLRMTGTDGDFGVVPGVVDCDFGVVPGVVTGDIGLHRTALKYTLGIFDGTSGGSAESLEMKQTGAVLHRSAVDCTSASERARTFDPLIKSQSVPICNVLQDSKLRQSAEPVAVPVAVAGESEGGNDDSDLSRLIAAWPTLSEPIRRAMLAILEAAM